MSVQRYQIAFCAVHSISFILTEFFLVMYLMYFYVVCSKILARKLLKKFKCKRSYVIMYVCMTTDRFVRSFTIIYY